jgi:hypothetical protein
VNASCSTRLSTNPFAIEESDEECIKEGKKRTIGKQGDRSKVEDEEERNEGEWTTCNRRGKGKAVGSVRGRGARGRGRKK